MALAHLDQSQNQQRVDVVGRTGQDLGDGLLRLRELVQSELSAPQAHQQVHVGGRKRQAALVHLGSAAELLSNLERVREVKDVGRTLRVECQAAFEGVDG